MDPYIRWSESSRDWPVEGQTNKPSDVWYGHGLIKAPAKAGGWTHRQHISINPSSYYLDGLTNILVWVIKVTKAFQSMMLHRNSFRLGGQCKGVMLTALIRASRCCKNLMHEKKKCWVDSSSWLQEQSGEDWTLIWCRNLLRKEWPDSTCITSKEGLSLFSVRAD